MNKPMLGAIEAGGTKFLCSVGTGHDDVIDSVRIPTTTPEATVDAVLEFFERNEAPAAVGIASFGPLELRRDHPAYGRITTTPKTGWSDTDLAGPISRRLGIPVGFDLDVIGSALGEYSFGAGQGIRNLVYVTVGTGVGGGVLIDGIPVPGLVHPEMGHVPVERWKGDDFAGVCPYHEICLEGMASGPAIAARWGRSSESLGEVLGEAIEVEAHYLASGLKGIVYALAPQRVILGGGVMKLPGLIDSVNAALFEQMNGYAIQPEHKEGFVVTPSLGDDSGIAGAFVLAERALKGDVGR
jgi:fructokinase